MVYEAPAIDAQAAYHTELFESNIPWAREETRRFVVSRGAPQSEWNDLRNAALVGLWEAASRYRSDRGASFRTYAHHIITHRMSDWLRVCDYRSRRDRAHIKAGRAACVNVPIDVYAQAEPAYFHDFSSVEADEIVSSFDETGRRVCDDLRDGWTQDEVAERIGRSASRVCQIVTRVRETLVRRGVA